MITSTRQYKITRTRATEARNTLAAISMTPKAMNRPLSGVPLQRLAAPRPCSGAYCLTPM
jgi:hypothetical protein